MKQPLRDRAAKASAPATKGGGSSAKGSCKTLSKSVEKSPTTPNKSPKKGGGLTR